MPNVGPGLTIDFVTKEDGTVTLHDRDSTNQVRVPMTEVVDLIARLCRPGAEWAELTSKYPTQERSEADD